MPPPHLPTTQSAVLAIEAVAARHGRAVRAQHDVGSDRTFAGLVGHEDGPDAIPHEALLEFDGSPRTAVRLFTHDEVTVTVEGIPFDVPRDSVPAFLNSVWSGLVHVRARTFPPSTTLIVTVPGEAGYRESLGLHDLTPWLSGRIR
ncbi:hypothetical protein ACIG0C_12895 [Kitasatospora aureofaciens]|uniref:Uncharacterized protein n=1 Tax=Kitasatospora aureofaciens TaxID=1894 RepID=A0A1E7N7L5_KITAU|nr:hypothetical protein [Kitasatospora aureofaciens]ARF81527.1 hypothetical protein B6264_23770 [Kitasatospora aureofaciens]OEV36697.1 hypothetical protein HS99_0028485 [Kitasatospora aureofaciens]GGU58113.1 hypothetical protein GCM10010502_05930 [Kitasatospora aureofaciens]